MIHRSASPVMAGVGRADIAALAPPSALARWQAGVHAAGDVGANVITIYDVIGYDWWTGGGVTVASIDEQLKAIGGNPVEVHINSPGGDMFEGIAIHNRLQQHTAGVTVKVMGLAASAASLIAMAGRERLIGAGAFLMIHDCWVLAAGNQHELRDVADYLAPFDQAMAELYARASGQPADQVRAMLDAETWMNGSKAVELGFATGLLAEDAVTEDLAATAAGADLNAIRSAEISLCKTMSRADARKLIAKIKGTPGAAHDPATPGAGADHDWLGAAAQLAASFRS